MKETLSALTNTHISVLTKLSLISCSQKVLVHCVAFMGIAPLSDHSGIWVPSIIWFYHFGDFHFQTHIASK